MLDGAIPGAFIIWDLRGQLPSLLAFVPFIPCSLFGGGGERKHCWTARALSPKQAKYILRPSGQRDQSGIVQSYGRPLRIFGTKFHACASRTSDKRRRKEAPKTIQRSGEAQKCKLKMVLAQGEGRRAFGLH